VKFGAVSPKRSAMILSRFCPRKRERENISPRPEQQVKIKLSTSTGAINSG
jgi:hypothetical protein